MQVERRLRASLRPARACRRIGSRCTPASCRSSPGPAGRAWPRSRRPPSGASSSCRPRTVTRTPTISRCSPKASSPICSRRRRSTEGAELEVKLVEVGLHDATARVGKVDGFDVIVADAAKLVGKQAKVVVGRVLDGQAFASLASAGRGDGREPDHVRERGGEADAGAGASQAGGRERRAARAASPEAARREDGARGRGRELDGMTIEPEPKTEPRLRRRRGAPTAMGPLRRRRERAVGREAAGGARRSRPPRRRGGGGLDGSGEVAESNGEPAAEHVEARTESACRAEPAPHLPRRRRPRPRRRTRRSTSPPRISKVCRRRRHTELSVQAVGDSTRR